MNLCVPFLWQKVGVVLQIRFIHTCAGNKYRNFSQISYNINMIYSCIIVSLILISVLTTTLSATSQITSVLNTTSLKSNDTDVASKLTRKQLAGITRNFVNYHLYFTTISHIQDDLYSNMNHKNNTNTDQLLSKAITTCVNTNFTPRILNRNQVSWKPKSDMKPKPKTSSNDSNVLNNTTETTNENIKQEDENNSDKNNQIHSHLIFALLLPNHPYSQDVRRILTTITPMYPQAMIVLGNAYHFKDMASKYFVTSYPKILYFKSGIFIESYSGSYTVEDLSAQFTEWIGALPQAIPLPFQYTQLARTTSIENRDFNIYEPGAQMKYGLSIQPLPFTTEYPLVDVQLPKWIVEYLPYLSYMNNTMFIEKRSERANKQSYKQSQQQQGTVLSTVESIVDVNISTTSTTNTTGNTTANSSNTIPLVITVTVPFPNIEPFLGSLTDYATWDSRVFLLAGLYTILRTGFLFYKYVFSSVRDLGN